MIKEIYADWRANSPFYDETHQAFSDNLRKFFDREAVPHVDEWEAAGIGRCFLYSRVQGGAHLPGGSCGGH